MRVASGGEVVVGVGGCHQQIPRMRDSVFRGWVWVFVVALALAT
jgi:hypothetical protein